MYHYCNVLWEKVPTNDRWTKYERLAGTQFNMIFMDMRWPSFSENFYSTFLMPQQMFPCKLYAAVNFKCIQFYLFVFEILHLSRYNKIKIKNKNTYSYMHWEKQNQEVTKTKYGQFVRGDWYRLFLAIVSGDVLWKICILSNCM